MMQLLFILFFLPSRLSVFPLLLFCMMSQVCVQVCAICSVDLQVPNFREVSCGAVQKHSLAATVRDDAVLPAVKAPSVAVKAWEAPAERVCMVREH